MKQSLPENRYAGKKGAALRTRLSDEMIAEIRRLAELEDRTYMGEIRHLLRLGLEEETRRLKEANEKRKRGK